MPGNNTEFNDPLSRAWMIAWMIPIIWMLKWTIRIYNFLGLWPLIIVLGVDAGFTQQGVDVPDVVWGLLIGASIVFCIFWTSKNVLHRYHRKAAPPAPMAEQTDGVFFGTK